MSQGMSAFVFILFIFGIVSLAYSAVLAHKRIADLKERWDDDWREVMGDHRRLVRAYNDVVTRLANGEQIVLSEPWDWRGEEQPVGVIYRTIPEPVKPESAKRGGRATR